MVKLDYDFHLFCSFCNKPMKIIHKKSTLDMIYVKLQCSHYTKYVKSQPSQRDILVFDYEEP